MNMSEEQDFDGMDEPSPQNNGAAEGADNGSPAAVNNGDAGSDTVVTPDMLFLMMRQMQEQTQALQAHVMNLSA